MGPTSQYSSLACSIHISQLDPCENPQQNPYYYFSFNQNPNIFSSFYKYQHRKTFVHL